MKTLELSLKGTPYEKGFTHGSAARAQVLRSLETYKTRYQRQRQLSWEDAKRIARRFENALQGECAHLSEEMRGIADGAGLDFYDVLALNLRSEILYSGLSTAPLDEGECTAFSAVAPATRDGHALAGQSWDFTRAQREAAIIAHIPAEGKTPAMLMLLEGGMVGGKGMNSCGISLTLNALTTKRWGVGVPLHVRMRRALEADNLSEAYRRAAVMPIPVPVNLILTHKDGLSLSLELDPEGVDVILPDNGVIVHTNHYYGPRMRQNHAHNSIGSTYMRLQRMNYLMRSKKDLTAQDLMGFLRDHAGYPTSICVHPHPDTPESELPYSGSTNHAFVCDLTDGRFFFVAGNPCEGEFEELKL